MLSDVVTAKICRFSLISANTGTTLHIRKVKVHVHVQSCIHFNRPVSVLSYIHLIQLISLGYTLQQRKGREGEMIVKILLMISHSHLLRFRKCFLLYAKALHPKLQNDYVSSNVCFRSFKNFLLDSCIYKYLRNSPKSRMVVKVNLHSQCFVATHFT